MAWLADLLSPTYPDQPPANVLVNMVGGSDERARRVFAESLTEKLYGRDLEFVEPLQNLDEGLRGYISMGLSARPRQSGGGDNRSDKGLDAARKCGTHVAR